MSEAARHQAPHDPASRPQPGPLRDWLAAMKAATVPSAPEAAAAPARAPAEDPRRSPDEGKAQDARVSESTKAWTPRVVTPEPVPADAAESDLSDLMAENIMLKAKLSIESDRYAALQGVIARELRNLRAHVEDEMRGLEEMREERDRLAASQADLAAEVQDLRAKLSAEAAHLTEMRGERDLWAARAEALAQPIFQKRSA